MARRQKIRHSGIEFADHLAQFWVYCVESVDLDLRFCSNDEPGGEIKDTRPQQELEVRCPSLFARVPLQNQSIQAGNILGRDRESDGKREKVER